MYSLSQFGQEHKSVYGQVNLSRFCPVSQTLGFGLLFGLSLGLCPTFLWGRCLRAVAGLHPGLHAKAARRKQHAQTCALRLVTFAWQGGHKSLSTLSAISLACPSLDSKFQRRGNYETSTLNPKPHKPKPPCLDDPHMMTLLPVASAGGPRWPPAL